MAELNKLMDTEIVYLPCEDAQEILTFLMFKFPNDKTFLCEFNIADGYCYNSIKDHGLGARFNRAWHALIGKPLYYTGVSVLSMDRAKQWLNDCLDKIEEAEKNGYTNYNEETNEEN